VAGIVRIDLKKTLMVLLVTALAVTGLSIGATMAFGKGAAAPTALPCKLGGSSCISIGFTEAWFGGDTVDLEYSHDFFCVGPPASGATTRCEAGAEALTQPPSGPVVSVIYQLIPLGFTPSSMHCPVPGRCIDHPRTIDLTAVFGPGASNAPYPAHANIIEDAEAFQSTWWPVTLVGVKSQAAWDTIAAAKSVDAMDACEESGDCTSEYATNTFLFFQVLGPGMSPGGPA
jgi:hypothetical protein